MQQGKAASLTESLEQRQRLVGAAEKAGNSTEARLVAIRLVKELAKARTDNQIQSILTDVSANEINESGSRTAEMDDPATEIGALFILMRDDVIGNRSGRIRELTEFVPQQKVVEAVHKVTGVSFDEMLGIGEKTLTSLRKPREARLVLTFCLVELAGMKSSEVAQLFNLDRRIFSKAYHVVLPIMKGSYPDPIRTLVLGVCSELNIDPMVLRKKTERKMEQAQVAAE